MAKSASEKINWVEGSLFETFNLKRFYEDFPLLNEWLKVENNLLQKEIEELEQRSFQLVKCRKLWNAGSLKMKFVALILDIADLQYNNFETIFGIEVKAKINSHLLKATPSCLIAHVIYDLIEPPYCFCLQVSSWVGKDLKEPFAELLKSMLITQELNKNGKPIYGCYVLSENWYFIVLNGKEYSVSIGYNATSLKGLQNILLILRKFKHILLTELTV